MFGFGQPNPQRVIERQLNKARLDLLEAEVARESCEAHVAALKQRITRLETAQAPRTEQSVAA